MAHVLIPGSFDPLTNGHWDIIKRAAQIFERITVGIIINPNKTGLFTPDERCELIRKTFSDLEPPVELAITTFSGLLAAYVASQNYTAIVKGLRCTEDFSYELPMDHMNSYLAQIQTLYLATSPQWSFVSSSLVKEVAQLGGDISQLVPAPVHSALLQKFPKIN